MYKNISNSEKTIKDMLNIIDNDNYVIDKILTYYSYKNYKIEFGNILNNYKDYFNNYLIDADVSEDMFYLPTLFAEKYYGTPDLDFLVLYFAGMTSLFEFNKKKIKMLPPNRIIEINKLFSEYKETVLGSYKNPKQLI